MLHLTQETFQETISSWVVMIDFYADRCWPCQILGKLMPHLAKKYDGKAIVAKVDTEVQKYLAGTHNIFSLPTVLVFKDWVEVERIKGLLPPEKYSELLDIHLWA